MLGVRKEKFIVAPPERKENDVIVEIVGLPYFTLFYAATPDCHKNFELLCDAASPLEQELGKGRFKVVLTISGQENKYAQQLHKKFSSVGSIEFAGFMSREKLFGYYHVVDCLVFPLKAEAWGLSASELMATGKSMLLADLPHAHETVAGSM